MFPPDELAALVGLPAGVETLGWLCLGWPDELPPGPGLERAGWSRRAPLETVVLKERWSAGTKPPMTPELRAPDQGAVVGARDQADTLLTPPGSLGVLDRALDRLVALGTSAVETASLVLVAADHPVTRHKVSTYPSTVTREVLEATVAGESLGAAAARAAGLGVVAVDAGVDGEPVAGALDLRPAWPPWRPGRRGRADARPMSTGFCTSAGKSVAAPKPSSWPSARPALAIRPWPPP